MRRLIVVSSFLILPFAVGACNSDKKGALAQEQCKQSAKDEDSCKTCCSSAGAAGSTFLPGNLAGSGCTCQ